MITNNAADLHPPGIPDADARLALIARYPDQAAAATPPSVPAPAPRCPTHGPMKASTTHGGWYCPTKIDAEGHWCPYKVA